MGKQGAEPVRRGLQELQRGTLAGPRASLPLHLHSTPQDHSRNKHPKFIFSEVQHKRISWRWGFNKYPSLKDLTLTCSDMQMVPEHPQCSIQRLGANRCKCMQQLCKQGQPQINGPHPSTRQQLSL